MLQEVLEERVISSRGLRNPRGLKRKMTKFPALHCRRPAERLTIQYCFDP
jgi:hypothetical protein